MTKLNQMDENKQLFKYNGMSLTKEELKALLSRPRDPNEHVLSKAGLEARLCEHLTQLPKEDLRPRLLLGTTEGTNLYLSGRGVAIALPDGTFEVRIKDPVSDSPAHQTADQGPLDNPHLPVAVQTGSEEAFQVKISSAFDQTQDDLESDLSSLPSSDIEDLALETGINPKGTRVSTRKLDPPNRSLRTEPVTGRTKGATGQKRLRRSNTQEEALKVKKRGRRVAFPDEEADDYDTGPVTTESVVLRRARRVRWGGLPRQTVNGERAGGSRQEDFDL